MWVETRVKEYGRANVMSLSNQNNKKKNRMI